MGQYYKIANLDKKEFIKPLDINNGMKFLEIVWNNIGKILLYLLRKSDVYGICDISNGQVEYCGRWAGNRIVVIGEYDSSNLYSEITEENNWINIGREAVREFNSIIKENYKI